MLLEHLQENLITLLTWDREQAPIIRGLIEPSSYGGPYRIIAARIYAHLDRFKKPPGDHLPDLLADKLEKGKEGEGELYAEIIEALYSTRKGINAEYVMSQLETFIKRQSMRSLAIDLAKTLQRDTEESISEAEQLLASANKIQLKVFDPGVRGSDKKRGLQFLDKQESSFPTGIAELDRRGLGPARKELWVMIGTTGSGKTWGLGQIAKMALMQRMRVCHISLEMSEQRAIQRYYQTLFAIAKRKDPVPVTKILLDKLGRISGLDTKMVAPKLSFDDPDIRKKLERRIDRWALRLLNSLIVKEFPTGALTVGQLTAYLDNLESSEQFTPDLLVLDYPALMRLNPANLRLELDQVIKGLRGIAVTRNIAVAIVSQSHRSAVKAKQVGIENIAEAFSISGHADVILTYSQTEAEHKVGLGRLYVAKGRNDADKFSIVLSQSYALGQFVMASSRLVGSYWGELAKGRTIRARPGVVWRGMAGQGKARTYGGQ